MILWSRAVFYFESTHKLDLTKLRKSYMIGIKRYVLRTNVRRQHGADVNGYKTNHKGGWMDVYGLDQA